MSWEQTWREWGNGRFLRGNAHFMLSRASQPDGARRALCGYAPGVMTRMMLVSALSRPEQVQRCPKCEKRADRLARGA